MKQQSLFDLSEVEPLFNLPLETTPLEAILAEAANDVYSYERLCDSLEKENYADAYIVLAVHCSHVQALHWVYKSKWAKKYKIPLWQKLSNKGREAIKAFGEFLRALLELCIQIHPIISSTYKNACEIFQNIVWELKAEDINSKIESKAASIKLHQNRIGLLKQHKNPYQIEDFPHTHSLIKLCLAVSEKSDLFRDKYFLGTNSKLSNPNELSFASAYSAWVQEIKVNSDLVLVFTKESKKGEEKLKVVYHKHQSKGLNCLYL